MSSWRATLRIARRDAVRAKGRSALVLAMIALPVLGVTAVDVIGRTYQLSDAQKAARSMGRADAALTPTGYRTIRQYAPDGYGAEGSPSVGPGLTARQLAGLVAGLPAGTTTLPDRTAAATVTAGDRAVQATVRQLAYAEPLAAGIYRQGAGRPPRTPGEVALTADLAQALHVRPGGTVTLEAKGAAVRVVGLVDSGRDRSERTALVAAGGLPTGAGAGGLGGASGSGGSAGAPRSTRWTDRLLVEVPGRLTLGQVRALNARGVLAETARPVPGLRPRPGSGGGTGQGQTITALVLVVGMGLLEVVLLAGPAFAVGARRQRRQLALLSATGAEARDVRRTVLGGGLALGLAGGLVGVAGGVALAAASPLVMRHLNPAVPGPFDARPLELAAIVVLGVGTALLAALLPARAAARQDVVAALSGRRGTVAGRRLTPAVGVAAAVAGAGIAFAGAATAQVTVILIGSVVAELGLVATTPALVGLAGRLGPRLPLAPRLALRDAARNRSRTAPAVAAILAAVAGSVAVGTFVASLDAHDRASYTPTTLAGDALVRLPGNTSAAAVTRAEQVLRHGLPARDVVPVRLLTVPGPRSQDGYIEVTVPPGQECPTGGAPTDPRCAGSAVSFTSGPLVGDPATVRAVNGADSARSRAALAAGRTVAPAASIFPDGRLRLVLHPGDGTRERHVALPATPLPAGAHQEIVLSAPAARQIGGGTRLQALAVPTTRTPTTAEEDGVRSALERAGLVDAGVYVERGYVSHYGIGLLALLGGSALLVLGASGIATGLAAADGLADLSTLAAVGATPTVRRMLAAAQSFVTAGLGTALGAVAGLVPAIGLIRAYDAVRHGTFPLVLPWTSLLVTVVVVPLVAAAAAAAVTRSRLPLVHRTG